LIICALLWSVSQRQRDLTQAVDLSFTSEPLDILCGVTYE